MPALATFLRFRVHITDQTPSYRIKAVCECVSHQQPQISSNWSSNLSYTKIYCLPKTFASANYKASLCSSAILNSYTHTILYEKNCPSNIKGQTARFCTSISESEKLLTCSKPSSLGLGRKLILKSPHILIIILEIKKNLFGYVVLQCLCGLYLWYWVWRNWNSSLIRSRVSG